MLLSAYFLEAGLLLAVVPWSSFWEHNYFALSLPVVGEMVRNSYVRGAVTGIGIVSVLAGAFELFEFLSERRLRQADSGRAPF